MNKIVNKFLLAGDKFMIEMHLKQPGFTYSVCGPFTKNKERIQKFKETGDTSYIYKNEFDKACFQHDIERRTFSKEVLRDKAFNIAKNPKYYGYQKGLASVVYKFFNKKSKDSGVANNEIKQNLQLAEELHKPIIRNFKKEQFIQDLKAIFGVLIWQICNHWQNITKKSSIYCVQLFCLVNMHGLFL